ncbi:hypothetical protein FUA23_15750 [Neolewinella aurantiaca]|uniref:Uncharacterized protein n=1 Tax=Neolewinella aurantiaca TaxID=2602767 RepID=A0A5C7FTT8_9BACT|nr:hypothetical protein [Neolewinella aurantiaca]TXF88262.1 hypothetical protein FUA23_15750 [Neolewinella aurantiaca]
MKNILCAFLFLCLFTSCEKDPASFTPPCEIAGQEILELIRTEGLISTRLEASGIVNGIGVSGTPTINGCILEYEGTFYNLEQLVSFEADGVFLRLNFP